MMENLTALTAELSQTPTARVIFILTVSFLTSIFTSLVLFRIIFLISGRTKTDLDDRMASILRWPLGLTILLIGAWLSLDQIQFSPKVLLLLQGIIRTLIVLIWGMSAMKVGRILLEGLSKHLDRFSWIQPKTLPLFDIALKVTVIGGFLYFLLIAWDIDVTSWVASAGVIGIAVGFAAKDTLANLFAGVFILADAPYKIGDFIILDTGLRGLVTEIGIRSTRILTRDDIEITVPNAVIGNSEIINETGGRHQKMRVRVKVSVAYGSDIDQVRSLLMKCVEGVDHLSPDPRPRVRFREFGDSGLLFELLAWIGEPVFRGRVLDTLNTNVYEAFLDAGIEIPYPKRDLYLKNLPPTGLQKPAPDETGPGHVE